MSRYDGLESKQAFWDKEKCYQEIISQKSGIW